MKQISRQNFTFSSETLCETYIKIQCFETYLCVLTDLSFFSSHNVAYNYLIMGRRGSTGFCSTYMVSDHHTFRVTQANLLHSHASCKGLVTFEIGIERKKYRIHTTLLRAMSKYFKSQLDPNKDEQVCLGEEEHRTCTIP